MRRLEKSAVMGIGVGLLGTLLLFLFQQISGRVTEVGGLLVYFGVLSVGFAVFAFLRYRDTH